MPAAYPAPRLLATPAIIATIAPGFPTQEGETQEHSWRYSNVKCQRQQCEFTGIQNGLEQNLNSLEHMMSHTAAMGLPSRYQRRTSQSTIFNHPLQHPRIQPFTRLHRCPRSGIVARQSRREGLVE